MYGKVISTIILVAGLFGAPSASALTFYTDETAWRQAVSGYQVGIYPYTITRTDYITLYDYDPSSGFTAVSSTTNLPGWWSDGGFQPTFYAHFSVAGLIIDSSCWGIPCSGIPALTEVLIQFATPTYGFAGYGHFAGSVNGQPINDIEVFGFFGVVGDLSRLDFLGGACPYCDDFNNYVQLDNIAVAFLPVPEPSSIVTLSTMLLLLRLFPLAGLAERKRRRLS